MARLVEFPLEGGGSVLVEVDEQVAGPVRAAGPGEIAAKAQQSFQATMSALRPIAESVLSQVRDLGPGSVTLELGIKFTAGAGVVIAKTETEGTLKLILSWKKGEATP